MCIRGRHEYVSDQRAIAEAANQFGGTITDIRKPKPKSELHFWSGKIFEVKCPIIAVIGMDCAIGKRSTVRFLLDGCKAAGLKAEMIFTGQTGWMQSGKYGFVLDSTYNDFVSGELEHAIVACYEPVSYTHLRAHETVLDLVCRLLLEKKKKKEY